MKKNIFTLSSVILLAGGIIFTSCKKDDVTAPVITVNGTDQTVILNTSYSDLGATANDAKDGAITPVVSGVVDVNTAGVYEIVYKATDAAGNVASESRMVTVYNQAQGLAGDYNGVENDGTTYVYAGNTDASKVVKVSPSATENNKVYINRLGDFANNIIAMNVTGNTINIPSQTVSNVGTGTAASCNLHNRTSSGTGSKIVGAPVTTFTLTYSDAKESPCTGNRVAVTATFTAK